MIKLEALSKRYGDKVLFSSIDFKLTIADESDYTINDNHQGLSVSLHVAKTIYNRILTDYNINKNVEETLDLITDWNVVRNKIIPKLI